MNPSTPLLTIDLEKHETAVRGKVIHLAPKERGILWALARAKGRVMSRDQILESVYEPNEADVYDRTIDQHIARIRKAIGKDAEEVLRTVVGAGYCLKNFEILSPKRVETRVLKITRSFGKDIGARLVLEIKGDALPGLNQGDKLPLALA